ncbi:hypothetical protein EUGRSUZ_E00875 [Eucalyptus grandis]|uniref:Uncharacterized protein n=2 Tax=Eucalyptus grandis TaxID=71139 RepID=A0ACC3KTF3_EUCGR|nr:hypothetical protein EUGRSUZ_E00875 [Eucalyptus grandis]
MGNASSMLTQYGIEEVQDHCHNLWVLCDQDRNGKVSFNDILEALRDLSGLFMSNEQREQVLVQVLKEVGYTRELREVH